MVTCVLSVHANEAYAARLVAQHIDLIVHLTAEVDPRTGKRRRVVSEVIEVDTGEGHRPAVTDLFAPGPAGVAVPVGAIAALIVSLTARTSFRVGAGDAGRSSTDGPDEQLASRYHTGPWSSSERPSRPRIGGGRSSLTRGDPCPTGGA